MIFIGLGHLVQLLGNRQQANCVTDPPSTESGKEQFGVGGRRVVGTWGGDRQAVAEWRRQLGTATNHADHCWTTPITNPTFRPSGKALSIAKNFPKSRSTLFFIL